MFEFVLLENDDIDTCRGKFKKLYEEYNRKVQTIRHLEEKIFALKKKIADSEILLSYNSDSSASSSKLSGKGRPPISTSPSSSSKTPPILKKQLKNGIASPPLLKSLPSILLKDKGQMHRSSSYPPTKSNLISIIRSDRNESIQDDDLVEDETMNVFKTQVILILLNYVLNFIS